jgi:uncharacterized protein (DUF983 family)
MHVTRSQIVSRGIANRCPNCGHSHTLFSPGAKFTVNHECPQCGTKFERGEGFFLGPFVINYTITIGAFIVPVILLSIFNVIGTKTAIALGGSAALLVPVLLYRWSWSWWLMCYFYFLPEKLPNNRGSLREDEEE